MVALPDFRSVRARKKVKEQSSEPVSTSSDRTLTPTNDGAIAAEAADAPKRDIKRATGARQNAIFASSFFFSLSAIFLILAVIGNVSAKPVIRGTYFFKLDLTNVLPASTPSDVTFVNSLARSLGLHDFYQNFYWFNPVEILLNELLSGATIALPAEVTKILTLVKIASHLMFGFFITGTGTNFAAIFLAPVCIYLRWIPVPFTIFTFISALLTTTASIIATVMFSIFRNVVTSQAGLNIGASVGKPMLAFMWIGSGSSIIGFIIHLCLVSCCASRRDAKLGKKKGSNPTGRDAATDEKKTSVRRRIALPIFKKRPPLPLSSD